MSQSVIVKFGALLLAGGMMTATVVKAQGCSSKKQDVLPATKSGPIDPVANEPTKTESETMPTSADAGSDAGKPDAGKNKKAILPATKMGVLPATKAAMPLDIGKMDPPPQKNQATQKQEAPK